MTFQDLKFLTDENIDVEVVRFLRSGGADVTDIKELGHFRMSDREILEMAHGNERVVISQDSDFGTLIFRDRIGVFGVIYLRPGDVSPEIHVESMYAIRESGIDFQAPFIVVAENNDGLIKIRLRQI